MVDSGIFAVHLIESTSCFNFQMEEMYLCFLSCFVVNSVLQWMYSKQIKPGPNLHNSCIFMGRS